MNKRYKELSIIPNHRIDHTTGEVHPIIKEQKGKTALQALKIVEGDDENHIYNARQICGEYGETMIREIFKKHIGKEKHHKNKGFDIKFIDGTHGEIKTGRAGNRCIIIESQLEKMSQNGYYCLVFYKIDGYQNPTSALKYAKSSLQISPETYLKRQIKIHSIYIFPRSDIVYFFNHPTVSKHKIRDNKRGQPIEHYVGIGIEKAQYIFNENIGDFPQTEFTFLAKKGPIPVFVRSFPEIQL